MEKFWGAITGAPWWVYVLFICLVAIGIQSMQPRKVSIQRVVLLPLVFLAWSAYGLYEKVLLGFLSLIPLWFVFLAIGTCLGILEVHSWKIAKDHEKGEITIPGNYSTLILILAIFILKFFWGYFYATSKEVSYWIYFADTLTSAFVTGFFVGRAGVFFKRYHDK